jgi:release factor glutamine methyltransferase
VDVAVHRGSWARAVEFGPYDLIVCNPPYVPHDPILGPARMPTAGAPRLSWDAGYEGRLVLDPLCASVAGMLAAGGSLLLVQSEFSVPRKTLAQLAACGLDADVIARQWIPFGPVLASQAQWLEDTGRLEPGRREEELLVIKADKA